MRVSVELPDPPRIDLLLQGLSQQYQEVVSRLMQLTQEAQRADRFNPVLQALASQQDALVSAFERMMQVMADGQVRNRSQMQDMIKREVSEPQREASDNLIRAIRGMKSTISSMPENLGMVMSKQMKDRQNRLMKQEPEKKPSDNGSSKIVSRLDRMESALLQGLKGSRNRTFGTNY